jgi:hypothetical protein
MFNSRVLKKTFSSHGAVNTTMLNNTILGTLDINFLMHMDEIYKNGIVHINVLTHRKFNDVYTASLGY